ncbi:MAG: hypothetical protein HY662_00485 [Chloroflexi bacterium]|nr:hypothetical protein [Chloroflexota bacterium]
MSDEIKSALEIAMEKTEQLGEATEEERLKWKYSPQGEQMAATYLKEDVNLIAELGKHPEMARKYIAGGMAGVLIRNISLPKSDVIKKINKKAMDGLKLIKTDKVKVENVFSQIRRIFEHYVTQGEQQRKQAYQALKNDLESKMQQALQQQMGVMAGGTPRIDVERHPQFQQEWRRLQAQLDAQYGTLLNEYKEELSSIP